jgi:hypothetical protein
MQPTVLLLVAPTAVPPQAVGHSVGHAMVHVASGWHPDGSAWIHAQAWGGSLCWPMPMSALVATSKAHTRNTAAETEHKTGPYVRPTLRAALPKQPITISPASSQRCRGMQHTEQHAPWLVSTAC